jgi:hypothetical protein
MKLNLLTIEFIIATCAPPIKSQRSSEMWKKQDDGMGAQPESTPKQTPEFGALDEAPIDSFSDSRFGKWDYPASSQKVLAQNKYPPSLSSPTTISAPSMAAYTEALNEFAKSASAFIEQLPLLTKARDAYERAMKAGAELRRVLDSGEENLQTLMTQMEQAVSVQGVKPANDRKKPEAAKVEAIRGTDESSSGVKRFL